MRRTRLLLLTAGYAALIFYLSSRSTLPVPLPNFTGVDKVAHALEYSGLGFLVAWAVSSYGVPRRRVLLVAAIVCSLYGASDELHQLFVPGRACDAFDWAADTLGGACGAAAWFWATRKESR